MLDTLEINFVSIEEGFKCVCHVGIAIDLTFKRLLGLQAIVTLLERFLLWTFLLVGHVGRATRSTDNGALGRGVGGQFETDLLLFVIHLTIIRIALGDLT